MILDKQIRVGRKSSRIKLESRHMRLVVAIARQNSVTRAARELHLSQSAVSHQLLNLERDLNIALFHRIGKTMIATPAGKRLQAYADRVLSELAAAEDAVRSEHEQGRVPLRLTAGCCTHYPWLATAVSRFTTTHRRIDARIIFDETRNELSALQAHHVDMIITTRPPSDRAFARFELFVDGMVAVVGSEHSLSRRNGSRSLRWTELSDSTILIYDIPDHDELRLRDAVQKDRNGQLRSKPLNIWRVQLTEAIIELAAAGQGVGVVGSRYMRKYQGDPRLCFIPLAPGGRRAYWAVWHKSNPRHLPLLDLAKEIHEAWNESSSEARKAAFQDSRASTGAFIEGQI
ncbi:MULTISPECIES: LysR family transcriptional regulator [Bradyrhizobium]|uniref:LysR family transcriptional regulator n=1 Tax=Bradyrhizobium TaxID=374 RepID=UPI00048124D4|nr:MULTISPECIES: LysR family transcriptional regulator [Bradyrhizobium]UFW46471.1 LysR family transcriptional regulator [Bradyrhizobium arachidis]